MERGTTSAQPARSADEAMKKCIDNCLECYRICTETLAYCTKMGGMHVEPSHLATMMTCARICQTSAEAMLLESPLHHHTCRACAEICRACADDCAKMAEDDAMKRCVDACRRCAESCSRMAAN